MSIIEIPKDPIILAFDEKRAAVQKLTRERLDTSRKKEQRRDEFLLERQSDPGALLDDHGRDLSPVTFEEDMRLLDTNEGRILRELKAQEKELEALKRKRAKIVVAANRDKYLDILRQKARHLVQVAKLNDAEARFHRDMVDADISSGLRPMGVTRVGGWSDSQSTARFHIAELREHFPELANEDFEA